jgi:magnesium chelatase subunit I
VASANPEDYTNRGRIITPLKDRFGAEVRTHYPLALADEVRLIEQEAVLSWPGTDVTVPEHLLEVVARWTRLVRESPQVDQRSGRQRPLRGGRGETGRRLGRPPGRRHRRAAGRGPGLRPAVRGGRRARQGGVRGGRGGPRARGAGPPAPQGHRRRLPRPARRGGPVRLQGRFDEGATVETGDLVPAADLLAGLGTVPGLAAILSRLGVEEESPGLAAAALELALEGLHLNRRLAKDEVAGRTVYGG